MIDKIKHSIKHTAIYSVGQVATKLIGVVLLPIYTVYFSLTEYGTLGILETTTMILTQTLLLGQPASFLRFYGSAESERDQKSILFTIFTILLGITALFMIFGLLGVGKLSLYFEEPEKFAAYFRLIIFIIALRILNNLFLNVLRAKDKTILYSSGNVLKILVMLSLAVYFVVFATSGIIGVLYAYIAGEILLMAILLPNAISGMTPRFNQSIFSASMAFGIPHAFAALASMWLQMGDQYIIKLLLNYAEVGLYNTGYRFASLLNVLFIQSFSLYYLPQAYKVYGQKGDRRYYSKMLTYFVFVLCWAGLALSLFGKEIIHIFAQNPDYWPSYKIIPIVTLGYVFSGAAAVVNLGIMLTKKTKFLAYAMIAAAVFNVILNFILIPHFRMMGAAITTLCSFLLLFLILYYFSNRLYKISYENLKIVKLIVVSTGLYMCSLIVSDVGWFLSILFKLILLIVFPFLLYFLKFYEPVEIEKITRWSKRNILNKIRPK